MRITLVALLLVLVTPSHAAESVEDHVARLGRAIGSSKYGEISRLQATLAMACKQEGLAQSLNDYRNRLYVALLADNKVNWGSGDSPELAQVLATHMGASYAFGVMYASPDEIKEGRYMREAICKVAVEKADEALKQAHGGS